ncbi:MAG TPA: DNA-binding domain-containing protein [Gemmataceae bacterium]|nr:DNA-binding domain-containing protein [Gemmataceae bacterium]
MHDLEQLQRWMQAVLMHPAGAAEGVASGEARRAIDVSPEEAERVVTRSHALTALERLAIYNRAYYARLLDCVRESYPVLFHALGEDAFGAFALDYLQKYPSRSYTLNDLGANFPRYLRESRPADEEGAAGPSWPDFVIDLATLEWTYNEVFDGPGVEGRRLVRPGHLRKIDPARWPAARLVPVPCLRLLALRYPVHEYYTAVRRKKEAGFPEPAETLLAVSRRRYVIRRYELTRPQYALLEALLRGESVGEAIGRAAELTADDEDRFAADLGEWFREWTAEELFLRVAR